MKQNQTISSASQWPLDMEEQVEICCAHCGARPHLPPERKLHWAEITWTGVGCVLALAGFVLAWWLLNGWLDQVLQHVSGHWIWHEPLDNWNM